MEPSGNDTRPNRESGVIMVVVLMVAMAVAVLAMISSSRVVAETKRQTTLEDETRAFNQGFAELHRGLNIVNNSLYDLENHNLVLRAAMSPVGLKAASDLDDTALIDRLGDQGGAYTTSNTSLNEAPNLAWLANPAGVDHGVIPGTTVRVYHARDYIQRLQKLRGLPIAPVDPFGASAKYYVLESLGRSGATVRMVAALVRETEPFSSFVFFQNQHTLGVSGKPRGLIHANSDIAFYFPNGSYQDGVTAVDGFDFTAGATQGNTNIMNGNPSAAAIELEGVDFEELKSKANLYLGAEGLDAEILMMKDGRVRIRPYTPPHWDLVDKQRTESVLIGYQDVTQTVTQQVQTGTTPEQRTRQVISGYTTQTTTIQVPVYTTQDVQKTRQDPIYDTRTVTATRWVEVFVPYDSGCGEGGTTVAGQGVLGEYQWVEEQYQTTETYISGYNTVTYTEQEQVQTGTTPQTQTTQVPVYTTETYTVDVPVYEDQDVQVTVQEPIYDNVTVTYQQWQYSPPIALGQKMVWVKDTSGVVYVDGRVLSIHGDLNGRLTVVSTDKVMIDGNIQYVDGKGETAMANGTDTTSPYVRNTDYQGTSVLGVVAKDDVLFTWKMPDSAEINGTLMSVEGRVGIAGFSMDTNGEPTTDLYYGLSWPEMLREFAYDSSGNYRTRAFMKDSLRRIGGLISQERIMETYIRGRNDGTAYVDAGFKTGRMQFDLNLLFNPPPNFVEVPRPVAVSFAPIFFVRNQDM